MSAMLRIAWFSPLPPVRSGIAAYSTELLPLIAGRYRIDVFVDGSVENGPLRKCPAGTAVYSAHDFVWMHLREPYDLVVYQLGNARCHDYMWPFLFRYPGLVVLHDGQLHHARAQLLLTRGRTDEYREEFRYNHPHAPAGVAELVIATLAGSLYYFWPMLGTVVRSARTLAVHSPWLAGQLREEFPGATIATLRMGVADPSAKAPAAEVADPGRVNMGSDPFSQVRLKIGRADEPSGPHIRARHGIPLDSIVFAAYGLVTPEKRIPVLLNVFAEVAHDRPAARLMLVGETTDYYDVASDARQLGVDDRVIITGYVSDEELPEYLEAADVCLCLRWPTSRETSASWLRALAAGRPTITTDLLHTLHVPGLDPRSWTAVEVVRSGAAGGGAAEVEPPVTVGVDILDERHSLLLAMRRLAVDATLRREIGQAARRYFEREHTLQRMADDYVAVIGQALGAGAPATAELPRHLRADGTDLARRLTAELGYELDLFER
jgi:glycosyltransferase involved in cell wall biosynthesis